MDEHRRRAIEAGMDGFAPKPLRAAMLADSLAKAMQRSGAGLEQPLGFPAASTNPVERRAAVLERLEGRNDVLAELVEIAQREVPALLGEIEAAHLAGDRGRLFVTAHRLKGLVSNFDATAAISAASRLESASQKEGGDLEPLLVELRSSLADLRTELRGSFA
jgi:HPt (histidine-containing phosphotransfer) domain-containing protein